MEILRGSLAGSAALFQSAGKGSKTVPLSRTRRGVGGHQQQLLAWAAQLFDRLLQITQKNAADLEGVSVIPVGIESVKWRLRAAGLYGRRPARKPFISKKNRKARLDFASTRNSQWKTGVLWCSQMNPSLFCLATLALNTSGVQRVHASIRSTSGQL